MAERAMVVTDLDGTLFQRERRISGRNLATLVDLGRRSVVRVIATGRHLYSARKVLDPGFPIDFLIFSSGAGLLSWPEQRLLWKSSIGAAGLEAAFRVLSRRRLDFMVHLPIPDNHRFYYFNSGPPNPDFQARCALYREFALPGNAEAPPLRRACQLLAIEPPSRRPSQYAEIAAELSRLKVIRTTSPLDGRSCWIEIFSRQVSKARAARRLASRMGVARGRIMAVGNDYNDLDLLEWASRSFVVNQAPAELRLGFPGVSSTDESDFSEAVALWLAEPST